MSDESNPDPAQPPRKSTGPLKIPGALEYQTWAIPRDEVPDRNFLLRLAELLVFLIAVVGAVALGLGITGYFAEHTYIAAYLLAYAGFRCADLLVREDYGADPVRDSLDRRIIDQLPLLLVFAAAPFERTYFYGGEAPRWLGAFALLLELAGLWIALGARIQLGFFSYERRDGVDHRLLVRSGFYRFVRHPTYAGVFLAFLAWPIAYGAPISVILMIVIGVLVMRREIAAEEKDLLAQHGDAYAAYRDETDAMIPNVW